MSCLGMDSVFDYTDAQLSLKEGYTMYTYHVSSRLNPEDPHILQILNSIIFYKNTL